MSTNDRIPPLTIGMPVYNGEEYLERAIESLERQTFTDFVVVISDNASTDSTQDICRSFADRDPRVMVVTQEQNIGGGPNFEFVARVARSPYFKWASHDDVLAPDYLATCVGALTNAPLDVALVYPPTSLIDAEGNDLGEYADNLDIRDPSPSERLRRLLENYTLSNALHGVHRTQTLQATRLVGSYNSSDLVTLAEIVLLGKIWELDHSRFYRRWHEGMSTKANPTDETLRTWFDPNGGERHPMVRTRLTGEHIRSIVTAPIPATEKARSLQALAVVWGPRYWRVIGGEQKRAVYRKLGIRRPTRGSAN